MILKKLRLINFRNIKKAELSFNSAFKFFVLHGNNGAGKTSILEAISFLNSSKGMQKAKADDVINYNETNFGILAVLEDETELKLQYRKGKKELFIDNQKIQRLSQLSMLGNVCWLTPALDRLFFDSKKPRRDFFDRLVYSLDKDLASNLNNYSYLLQSRLKLLQSKKLDDIWLDKLEKQIAELNTSILKSRLRYIYKLNDIAQEYDLEFSYSGVVEKQFANIIENSDFDSLEAEFIKVLKENRTKDTRLNTTSFGVHRSDIAGIRPSEELILSSSSMGQHKKALIDLIICHIKIIKQSGDNVCLLIDEFTSHLDKDNQEYLFSNLKELQVQTFLTGTSDKDFAIIKDISQFIKVNNGEII